MVLIRLTRKKEESKMAYKLKKKLANKKNYGSKRDLKSIKYIVIHYTAGDGDTDENNATYFANNGNIGASAHYFVDDDSVTQSVPDNYVAWSVGGNKYSDCSKTGGGSLYAKCINQNSLSIEICDAKKDGKIQPLQATINNAIAFTKEKMAEYGIPQERVIRHFDVNGKKCPAYWCGTDAKDKKWLTEFWNKLIEFEPYLVKITKKKVSIYSGAGTNNKVVGQVEKGEVYTIVKDKKAGSQKWGKLKSGAGWILLSGNTKEVK